MAMLITILNAVLRRLVLAIISDFFIKKVILYGLEYLAKKTDNEVDDDLVNMFKEAVGIVDEREDARDESKAEEEKKKQSEQDEE